MFLNVKLLLLLTLVVGVVARPTDDDHVTMSGEPTHFQVDDKAAELEINANAMGVKVNAKPASLQVVSKPGSSSVPVAHPAVVVPQLPAPYMTAPFYPGPSTILPPPLAPLPLHKHHFFMDSAIGNYNSKKTKVPNNISKKSKISKNDGETKKRQWIQRLPLFSPIIPYYPQVTNIKVHPLVQEIIAQAQSRENIPTLDTPGSNQRYFIGKRPLAYQQRLPVMNGDPRNMIQRSVFIPPSSTYSLSNVGPYIRPSNQQLYFNPTGIPAAFSRGYYDPMISRDFIPAFNSPIIPTPKTFIPQGFIGGGGGMYQAMIPLGTRQRFSKRLTIPRSPVTTETPAKVTESTKASREKRSTTIKKERPKKRNSVAKRQFILTRPVLPQRVLTYVPVVLNPSIPPNMAAAVVPDRRNMVLNLPSKSQFILKVPSNPLPVSQQLPNTALYQPQTNINTMGLQRSLQTPAIAAVQMPGALRSRVQPSPFSLADLAGMQGKMSYQRSPHMTLYSSDPLLSQFQDQIFGDSSLEGRTQIPRRHEEDESLADISPSSTDDDEEAYIDEDRPTRLLDHVNDQGSYIQQTIPDGRTVFRKDHVGFGPISVEANTVESKDHSDASDMDLDSDKRKLIPRPRSHNNLDRRLKIPKPDS